MKKKRSDTVRARSRGQIIKGGSGREGKARFVLLQLEQEKKERKAGEKKGNFAL